MSVPVSGNSCYQRKMTEKKDQIQEKCDFVHVSGEFELSKLELLGVLLLVGV